METRSPRCRPPAPAQSAHPRALPATGAAGLCALPDLQQADPDRRRRSGAGAALGDAAVPGVLPSGGGVSEQARRETWEEWQAPDALPPTSYLTRDELIQSVARMSERTISVATLRNWESQAVLPPPVRRQYKGAVRALYAAWCVNLVWAALMLHDEKRLTLKGIIPFTRAEARRLSRTLVSPQQAAHRLGLGLPATPPLRLRDPFTPETSRRTRSSNRPSHKPLLDSHLAEGVVPYRVRVVIVNKQGPEIEYSFFVGLER